MQFLEQRLGSGRPSFYSAKGEYYRCTVHGSRRSRSPLVCCVYKDLRRASLISITSPGFSVVSGGIHRVAVSWRARLTARGSKRALAIDSGGS